MKTLAQRLLEEGVILHEQTITRNGSYRVTTWLEISEGARNNPEGFWIHVSEVGGFESHNSFYGKDGFEPFPTAQEAAEAAIASRNIIAIGGRYAVFGKR